MYHQLAVLRGTGCSTASLIGAASCNRWSNHFPILEIRRTVTSLRKVHSPLLRRPCRAWATRPPESAPDRFPTCRNIRTSRVLGDLRRVSRHDSRLPHGTDIKTNQTAETSVQDTPN